MTWKEFIKWAIWFVVALLIVSFLAIKLATCNN